MDNGRRQRFSTRYGLSVPKSDDLVRLDAPEQLRCGLLQIANERLGPSSLRRIICAVLRVRPDPSNWSEYPNVWGEVEDMVHSCEWNRVYDIIEGIHAAYATRGVYAAQGEDAAREFEMRINQVFVEEGIGWQLIDGEVQVRGDEASEVMLSAAEDTLDGSSMQTAHTELHEALRALSRRPAPNLSGAVFHAMAALECVARTLTQDPKPTLGDIVKKHAELFPKPLDEVVAKLWGFASEQARHARESRELTLEDAQLVVGCAAALCAYLAQKQ